MSAARVRIAPSILTIDFGLLSDAVAAAEDGGADVMHLDVMDGHFVPQITFGPLIVEAVRRSTTLPIEVHMMVANPHEQIAAFAEASGGGTLMPHIEATNRPAALIEEIRDLGCSPGLCVNPETPADALFPLLPGLDQAVVMLVNPGRGGQSMLVEHLDKVTSLRRRANEAGLDLVVEVDGGVKAHNAADCAAVGADLLVAGSAVFNHQQSPQEALAALREALAAREAAP